MVLMNTFSWEEKQTPVLFLFLTAGNSAFETADNIMGATNLVHMFGRLVT